MRTIIVPESSLGGGMGAPEGLYGGGMNADQYAASVSFQQMSSGATQIANDAQQRARIAADARARQVAAQAREDAGDAAVQAQTARIVEAARAKQASDMANVVFLATRRSGSKPSTNQQIARWAPGTGSGTTVQSVHQAETAASEQPDPAPQSDASGGGLPAPTDQPAAPSPPDVTPNVPVPIDVFEVPTWVKVAAAAAAAYALYRLLAKRTVIDTERHLIAA